MNIAVCDDDPAILSSISALLRDNFPLCEANTYTSELMLLDVAHAFDIYLLDIEMAYRDGLSVAAELRGRGVRAPIIFVTGHEGYMHDAFDVGAFHYLVKPINTDKFIEVLSRAIAECKRVKQIDGQFILIKSGGVSQRVLLSHIIYVDCYEKKAAFHTTRGEIGYYIKMDELEEQLGASFFRCHRSIIVNLAYVSEYEMNRISLLDGTNLPMSKQKYPHFVKAYLRYAQNGGAVNV